MCNDFSLQASGTTTKRMHDGVVDVIGCGYGFGLVGFCGNLGVNPYDPFDLSQLAGQLCLALFW